VPLINNIIPRGILNQSNIGNVFSDADPGL
jgi:hypothetical protein